MHSASMISAGSAWSRGKNTVQLPAGISVVIATKSSARWKNNKICWGLRWAVHLLFTCLSLKNTKYLLTNGQTNAVLC